MRRFKWKRPPAADPVLMLTVILLTVFGLFTIYSASNYTAALHMGSPYYYVQRQLLVAVMGFAAMNAVSRMDYHKLVRLAVPGYILSLILLGAVLVAGTASHGQKRWIYIGSIGFQPSELAKLMLIIFVSWMAARAGDYKTSVKQVIKQFIMILPAVGMVMVTNLSTGIIILGISFLIIFAANSRFRPFVLLTAAGCSMMLVFLKLAAYRVDRISAWLNVETHPKGYQTRQSLYALGTGGLFGRGYGKSIQKLAYVPEAHNDMIFSIVCEEWGLFGGCIIILMFVVLLWRCIMAANRANELFGALLVMGITAQIGLQMIINIAVVTNTMPNTGIPLPFISYGGTSLIFLLVEIGIIESVSRHSSQGIC